jgi:hypothetical protein
MTINLKTHDNGYYGYLNQQVKDELGSMQESVLTDDQQEILNYFSYDPNTEIITTNRAIETTLNSLYLGKQHKMSSGAENIYFTNLGSDINWYPMWAGLKDQSLVVNQGPDGYIAPSGRVYSDMFSLPLGGAPDPLTSIGYSGDNYFGVNIAGLGITTVAAEEVASDVVLEYRIVVNGVQVYSQTLPRGAQQRAAGTTIYAGDTIEWFFDHPVDIAAGTTLNASINKVRRGDGTIDNPDEELGVFLVRQGDTVDPNTGLYRYQATVHNRLFEDKDLELISPYLKYQAMDFGVDATGVSILLRDLSLPAGEQMLIPHNINTLQAVANGTNIQIKVKDGAKIIMESVPVSGISIDGVFVNSVLNNAVTELNNLFTNGLSFASQGNPVVSAALTGNNIVLTLEDSTSFTIDVTTLGVDENNFVASGSLSGTDLTLTMDDATTVVIDASSLAVDEDTTITFGTLDPNTNILTLNASDNSTVTVDVSSLAVDENLHVVSGALNANGIDLELTMSDSSVITVGVGSLAIDNDTLITSGTVSGTDILLTLSNASIITIDATTLATGTSTQVASGVVSGTDLILTMSDSSTVTIDATNMVNGSTMSATNDKWFISYGSNANQQVTSGVSDNTQLGGTAIYNQGPYYFGQPLTRGSEFKFNMSTAQQLRIGIWDGAEAATAYNSGQVTTTNWSTCFQFTNGNSSFVSSTNTDVASYQTGTSYVVANNAPLSLKFDDQGHLTLMDLTGGTETIIGKTTIPLAVQEFNVQVGMWSNGVFPNGIISTSGWTIVHDYAGTEAGILNGILDHTVIKSDVSASPGEKITFMLDEAGTGDFFGTDYTGASTGVLTAETQLENQFVYQTNEAITLTVGGVSDWNPNTSAANFFTTGAGGSIDSWRIGGAGTIQGLFSLRYHSDNSIDIYSEDESEVVATAKVGGDGSPIHLCYGVKGNRAYYSIPVISKQTIGQNAQPDLTFAPDVSNQTFNIVENASFASTIALDAGSDIVNMFGETDAPSWAVLNQATGEFLGTAPAFTGSADDYVINCKAANAIGGITNFTVTFTVTQVTYTNNKSLKFPSGNSTVLQGNATNVSALQRSGTGAGSSDAWSVSMWIKPSGISNQQTLFYYGGDDQATEGAIKLMQFSGSNIGLSYGTTNNQITCLGVNTFPTGQWNHVLITYDGGTTGVNSADLSSYYGRFGIYVNGVSAITQYANAGNGYDGTINTDSFKIGKYLATGTTDYLQDGIINQVAIWDNDQTANLATIYNSGATQDLSLLASPPAHYYEVETSVTNIPDLVGSADLTGYNFTNSDLVTDTP